jgi:hypothetical protein
MPVNMRTHGHGQGYADINFLIPELLRGMVVRKGPYYAAEGDFSSAGAIRLYYLDRLDRAILQASGGRFGYWRGLGAGSVDIAGGTLLAAGEVTVYDGLDFDLAWTKARFTNADPAGDRIPGSPALIMAAGVELGDPNSGWYGGLRWRYFGPRPLTEDNAVRSKADLAVQRADRLRLRERNPRSARRLQSAESQGQPDRVLLHVAPSGRAIGRCRRPALSSRRAARRAGDRGKGLLIEA